MNLETRQLSDQQVCFFHTFGYLHLPGWFRDDMARITQAFDQAFAEHAEQSITWVNSAHYNKKRFVLPNLPDRDPYLGSLLDDSRMVNIASRLCGGDYNYIPSEGNIFSGDTIWHSDSYNPILQFPAGHLYFKIALYLDAMPANNGAFRVLPGSHLGGVWAALLGKHLAESSPDLGLAPDHIPCQILESQPGDIIIFNHRLWHATCHAQQPRRMFYIGISQCFNEEKQNFSTRMVASYQNHFGSVYREPLRSNPNPQVQKSLAQFLMAEDYLKAQADHT